MLPETEFRMSIAQCRKHLPRNVQLTDDQVEAIREQMYALADVVINVFLVIRNNLCPIAHNDVFIIDWAVVIIVPA